MIELNDPEIMQIRFVYLGIIVVVSIVGTIALDFLLKKKLSYSYTIPIGAVFGSLILFLFLFWVLGLPFWFGFLITVVTLPFYLLYMGGLRNISERKKD